MIEKVDRENLDALQVFKNGDVNMLSLCDVQEHTVNEEQERFDIQMLAPAEAKVKEKL